MENSLFLFRKEKTKQAGYKIKIVCLWFKTKARIE